MCVFGKASWLLHNMLILSFQQLHIVQHCVSASCTCLRSLLQHDRLAYTAAFAQTVAHGIACLSD